MGQTKAKLIWVDHITGHPKRTADFYTEVLGHDQVPCDEGNGYTSYAMADDEGERFGVVEEAVFPDWPHGWVLYFEVDDFDARVEKIKRMGGEILRQFERECVFKDPSGTPVVIRARVENVE